MNDFTKEELKSIMYCVKQMKIHIDGYNPLKSKIQSLIDNYCEHEAGEPRLVLTKECVKCKQHLETRIWGLCE